MADKITCPRCGDYAKPSKEGPHKGMVCVDCALALYYEERDPVATEERMSDDEYDGRFGVVGGRGNLVFTVVDKMTGGWVHTYENKAHWTGLGWQLDNPAGSNTANERAWKLARKLNKAWRAERERRRTVDVPLTDPWTRPEVKV